jgi:hypothetical protein
MAFIFKLEHEDGTPADPPTLHTAAPNWSPWRHDPAQPRQDLVVIEIRPGRSEGDNPVLVVKPFEGKARLLRGAAGGRRGLRRSAARPSPNLRMSGA